MPDTQTPNYNLVKPEISGSPNTWGNKLNEDMNLIDAALKANSDAITALDTAAVKKAGLPIGYAPTDDKQVITWGMAKDYLQNASPYGEIIMWGGTIASIPAGFALCNGQTVNGKTTPNLVDKFIVAAGGVYTPGAVGGSATHNHGGLSGDTALTSAQMPVHNHSVNDPSHAHSVYDPTHAHVYSAGDNDQNYGGGPGSHSAPPYGKYTSYSATGISIYGAYTGISIQNAGSGAVHNHSIAAASNLPPFYALAMLMRVKYPWEA